MHLQSLMSTSTESSTVTALISTSAASLNVLLLQSLCDCTTNSVGLVLDGVDLWEGPLLHGPHGSGWGAEQPLIMGAFRAEYGTEM